MSATELGTAPPCETPLPASAGAGRRQRQNPRGSVQPGRPVLMITGGGLENGGGIGRMVGYVMNAWNDGVRPPMKIIDTRGPKYRRVVWPFFLLRSLLQIALAAPRRPILHVHIAANSSTWRKLIVVRVGRLLGLDYLLHLHDPAYAAFYTGLPRWARRSVRATFHDAARIVALGTPAATMVAELLGMPRDRIDIIPNGVPGPARLAPRDGGDGDREPRILFLGQLQRRKGVQDLIAALARREVAGLRWSAILAGGGPEQAGFEEQAVRLGVRERIGFPGWVNRTAVTALLEAADILVLPSYAEEMAMSVLEGMSFGLCVVCTPVGAQAEVVKDGVSALVVTPGDVEGLAAALARCIADPALRRRLGNGAREAYLRTYNVADYPDRIAAVYARL
jgi:glycosyltransferase involved in cell wall biosynthesis